MPFEIKKTTVSTVAQLEVGQFFEDQTGGVNLVVQGRKQRHVLSWGDDGKPYITYGDGILVVRVLRDDEVKYEPGN